MLLLLAVASGTAVPSSELLEKGIYTEETKGELKAAIEIYRQIVENPQADRSVAAQAQLRLGLCELKLGNKPRAISALENLTRQFPDADTLFAVVGQPLPQLLDEMLQQIEQNYLHEVDRAELMETALRAIAGKIDGRGLLRTDDLEFLDSKQIAELNVGLEQQVAGIGVALKMEAGAVVIGQPPLPGSPALAGGLLAGDRIVTIDGSPLADKPLETAVKLIRGPVGTPVILGVQRAGLDALLHVRLVRDVVRLPSVLGDRRNADRSWNFMLDDQSRIGYVRLTAIGKQSAAEMKHALDDLTARGMKALVLDLRNAPGGLLEGAIAIADLFVERGRIVTIKGRHGETAHDAKPEGTFAGFPMAVLVNRRTASAAEIIAACLQDHRRAVIVGERSFGQGIVRGLFPLKSGMGTLKLPVAAYYRPNGGNMNRFPAAQDADGWGVTPDPGYEVLLTDAELKEYQTQRSARDDSSNPDATPLPDRQLNKALEFLLARPAAP